MYQVTASYKVETVVKLQLNAVQRFFGMSDTESNEKGGQVQFTCETIGDGLNKLQYLIQNADSVTELSFRRI